jgi:hypothetical protein
MSRGAALECSFCRRMASGGVAGPTPAVYICPACIRLVYQMLEGPPLSDPEEDPNSGDADGHSD